MDGFRKIDLHVQKRDTIHSRLNKVIPVSAVPMAQRRNPFKKILRSKQVLIILGILVLLFITSIFTIILPAKKTYDSSQVLTVDAKATLDAAKKQNVELAATELAKTKADLTITQSDINDMGVAKYVPVVSSYYSDAQHLINAGFDGIGAAQVLIDSVRPYADVLGLKGQGSFVGGSAEQRIQTAVMTFGKITPRIDDIAKYLAAARVELDAVDSNHYPPIFGGAKIRDNLTKAKKYVDESVTFTSQARPLIKILPSLLGEPNEKKYLIIFQNDKELRPTGGFITAYAIFSVKNGVIHVDTSSDIYTLDATIANKPRAPQPLITYLTNYQSDPRLNIRDTNISPDFNVSMQSFMNLYQKSSQYQKVDGIIAVDTSALVAAMNILGDIQADGITFTTKIDPSCQCSQVIYQLEAASDQPVGYVRSNRKGIIGDLMYAIMSKAFSSSPKLYWGPLFQTMLTETSQKHILFDIFNTDAQSGIEALNAGGRTQSFDGDYLHINEANFGGAKSNLYVTESVLQNYVTKSDGTISKTVTISYRNPYPPSNCSLASGGLCLNAILRDWIRFYVPQGSQMVSSQGSEVTMKTYDELGKSVFDGFLEVRPQGTATFTITYMLPFKVTNGVLPLLIQKQPGTDGPQYTIQVNGKQVNSFQLLTDTELKINLQ